MHTAKTWIAGGMEAETWVGTRRARNVRPHSREREIAALKLYADCRTDTNDARRPAIQLSNVAVLYERSGVFKQNFQAIIAVSCCAKRR